MHPRAQHKPTTAFTCSAVPAQNLPLSPFFIVIELPTPCRQGPVTDPSPSRRAGPGRRAAGSRAGGRPWPTSTGPSPARAATSPPPAPAAPSSRGTPSATRPAGPIHRSLDPSQAWRGPPAARPHQRQAARLQPDRAPHCRSPAVPCGAAPPDHRWSRSGSPSTALIVQWPLPRNFNFLLN